VSDICASVWYGYIVNSFKAVGFEGLVASKPCQNGMALQHFRYSLCPTSGFGNWCHCSKYSSFLGYVNVIRVTIVYFLNSIFL
jgi:hypothetical protein